MKRGKKKTQQTFIGHIEPHDWDSVGRLIRVSLATEGACYVLSPAGYGERLLEMVGAEVRVCGTVEAHEGELYMTVRAFDPVDDLDLDDLDDEVEPGFEPWVEEAEPWVNARSRR